LEKVYFETSAFNYLLKSIRFESFLNTRELQRRRGRQLFVSPVTLWEAMLTGKDPDFLLFAAQNLFSEQMLAAPSEIIVRYLLNAYPENKVNYKIFTDLELGNIWGRMAHDNSVTFEYDKEKRSYMVPDISLSYGPETDNLLQMAREVLESGSEYGWSLAANIRSFYNAVKIDKELEKYKKDLSDYEKRLAALESICAANHPGALKKEGAM